MQETTGQGPGGERQQIEQAMAQARALHQAGRLAEAEQIYQQVLAVNPSHAAAMQLLGVAALQKGDAGRAAQLISQAIALEPAVAEYHLNLGQACKAAGDMQRAEA
jgi:Flp pilus assembly protein TadD